MIHHQTWPPDWDEMSNLHRGHSINASYQGSVHLAKQFQRRFFLSANQKQELPVVAMFGNGLSHMNRNLVGSIYMYGRFCIKFPQSRMKGE
jgi:hypothetical protein